MKLYERNLVDFAEVDDRVIQEGLANGTITIAEKFKEHHIVPQEQKREGKSAEQIYNELLAQGMPVEIHNDIYCKYVYNTYEAINPISPIDDYDEYEEVYVKGE